MSAQESRKSLLAYALASRWMSPEGWRRTELPRLEARGYRVSPREVDAIVALAWGGFFDER